MRELGEFGKCLMRAGIRCRGRHHAVEMAAAGELPDLHPGREPGADPGQGILDQQAVFRRDAGFFRRPERQIGGRLAMRMLEETGVCVIPGDAFGEHSSNLLRISYSTSMENIEEAFARMMPWLDRQPELVRYK